MKIPSLLIFFTVWILPAFSQEKLDDALAPEYRRIAEEYIERHNLFAENHGFPILENNKTLDVTKEYDPLIREEIVEVGSFQANAILQIRLESKTVIGFMNLDFENSVQYNKPPQSSWSEDRARKTGIEYLKRVGGFSDENLGEPVVQFVEQPDYPRYNDGYWHLRWPRKSDQGHLFIKDDVILMMTEKFGPHTVGYNLTSEYKNENSEIIAKGRAIKEANSHLEEIMNWPPARSRFHGFTAKYFQAELQIINLNHITKQSSIHNLAAAREKQARLAWVVIYKASYSGPREGKKGIPTDSQIQVWIDAENGEFLGGDFN